MEEGGGGEEEEGDSEGGNASFVRVIAFKSQEFSEKLPIPVESVLLELYGICVENTRPIITIFQ